MIIWQQPATELARLIRTKQLSARDCVAAHLSRIEAVNGRLNAIVTLVAERAMRQAADADECLARGDVAGPLHGLPMAHKDLQPTAGIRTTFGSPIFRDFVPHEDSPLVAALTRAGAITIGKTNTPEFGAGSQTFNPVFGPTLNPYDVSKTCGGSSGGAAVALACGMIPLADGTDMGGSLRNPAAFCGVVGFRPSASPVAAAETTEAWASLSVEGPMARRVEDVALLWKAMATSARAPTQLDAEFAGTRVAWWVDFGGIPFERRIADVVNAQRRLFESMGCVVDDAEPDLSGADEIFRTLRAYAFVRNHGDVVGQHRDAVKATILEEVARGERLTAADVAAAEQRQEALRQRVARFMERYAFFILPTTQVAPFDVNEAYVKTIDGIAMESYIDWMKSCYYISTLGAPAISVPCGFTPEGLPVGLQIVGRRGDDWSVLQLAHAYERARGPFAAPTI